MPKPTQVHPAERVDKVDFDNSSYLYSLALRDNLIRQVIGSGILEGFRVEVLTQSGSTLGHIRVYNGVASTWGGEILNSETGELSQTIPLLAVSTEYWIEVKIKLVDSDFDSRSFFDALVSNTSPIPPGQEVAIANTATRFAPTWEVVQPIRQNAIGDRTNGAYSPTRFSDSDELVIPLACIRTNASGQILSGDPNTDSDGNDIVSISVDGGSSINVIRMIGYGETSSTSSTSVASGDVYWGRKSSDQRPRLFERLAFPALAGASGDLIGDADSDHGVRDLKSMYDAITTQIARILYGVGTVTSFAGQLKTMDPDFNYVDITNLVLENTTGGSPTLNPTVPVDHFMNWTIQFEQGSWTGVYAQVKGSERRNGSNEYRLYLHRHSLPPTAFPKPDLTGTLPNVRLVHHRSQNWIGKPTPSSNNRGLNALDAEIVGARYCSRSTVTHEDLDNRLDAQKANEITIAPIDSFSWRKADVEIDAADHTTIVDAQTKINAILAGTTSGKGGSIYFRKGTYTLDTLTTGAGSTVFVSATGAESVIFKGDGQNRTILNFTGSAVDHTLFELSSCSDITFEDMTINGRGTAFRLSGCNNVRLKNCTITGSYVDLVRATVDFGNTTGLVLEDCTFKVNGLGAQFGQATKLNIRSCHFEAENGTATNREYVLYATGAWTDCVIKDCTIDGSHNISVFYHSSSLSRTRFRSVYVNGDGISSTAVSRLRLTDVDRCRFNDIIVGSDLVVSQSPWNWRVESSFTNSHIYDCDLNGTLNGLYLGGATQSFVHDNLIVGTSNALVDAGIGLKFENGSRRVKTRGNQYRTFAYAVQMFGSFKPTLDFELGTDIACGIALADSLANLSIDGTISNCSMHCTGATGGNYGIIVIGGSNFCITGCSANSADIGIGFYSTSGVTPANYSSISGNRVQNCTTAYNLDYLENSTVTGNLAYNPTTTGFDLNNADLVVFNGNEVVKTSGSCTPWNLTSATNVRAGHVEYDNVSYTSPWNADGDDGTNNAIASANVYTPETTTRLTFA